MNLVSCLWLAGVLAAAEPAASAPEVDADFPFLGEYVGDGSGGRYGLQVAALGNGQFSAMLHMGGLPGNGATGLTAYRLQGQRDNSSTLHLEGSGWGADIADGKSAQLTVPAAHLSVAALSKIERTSPTLGAKPPANAIVLFDGTQPTNLIDAEVTEDGLLKVGAQTAKPYKNFQLHLEFRTPYMPAAEGQKRGNSGVYLQRRYEVQVLESFGMWPQHNEAGALYRFKPPEINMSYPPLSWQTYDIDFTAAKFDPYGRKVSHAVLTVEHNGVKVHDRAQVVRKTGGGRQEGPEPLPILFQNHRDPVFYRNLWIVEKPDEAPGYPAAPCCTP